MDNDKLQKVREAIEKNTSKVSLRDLEKKGFRRVKVLKSGDIDLLIRQAVQSALGASGGGSDAISQAEIEAKSRAELDRMMREAREAQEAEEASRAERETLQRETDELRAELQAIKERGGTPEGLEERDREIQRLRARVSALERERLDLQQQAESGAETEEMRGRIEALEKDRDVLLDKIQTSETRRAEDGERHKAEVARRESALHDIERRLQAAREENDIAVRRSGQADAEVAGLHERIQRKEQEIADLETRLRSARDGGARAGELEATLKAREDRIRELEKALVETKVEAQVAAKQAERFDAMFGQVMEEVRAIKDRPAPVVAAAAAGPAGNDPELSKQMGRIFDKLNKISGTMNEDEQSGASEVALKSLFDHEDTQKAVISNVENIEVREQKGEGIKDHLAKLKAMKRGGKKDV